jgi:RNA recognition motif-containing protein
MSSKNQRVDGDDEMTSSDDVTCDLIVLGLPWKATDSDVKDYFEKFGDMMMVQLKTKDSGVSKGKQISSIRGQSYKTC